uniref:ATP synthase complex subunit 8 n=1 Tax=Caiman crocodilus TaxID=8499 RepID=Q9B211_CAICR|nr:ATP synthase F0 subunit 8 [Caiman crocodilus]CAC36947.1 ATP synthase F0 subunit 8 [Caiman crocodilus]
MPQLNPEPWLVILLITWTFFTTILQPQTTSLIPTNDPLHMTYKPPKTWPWPWTLTY